MPDLYAPFPFAIRHKLFQTDQGDVCACLHEAWPSLLADLSLLGPVVLISRSRQLSLVSFRPDLQLVPIPGTTEMLDVGSGFSLDTTELGAVIAGKEAESGNLSLHFFDAHGGILFKLLLATGADLDAFVHLVNHYARDPVARCTEKPAFDRSRSREGAILAGEKTHFQDAWPHFNPRLGGDFLPGGRGVSWWDALCLAGHRRAAFLTKVDLIKTILAAHQEKSPLRITTWHAGLQHEATVTPRRLERCQECLHLLDTNGEAHFFLEADMNFWVGYHGRDRAPAIHVFAPLGQRRGLIELEDGCCPVLTGPEVG